MVNYNQPPLDVWGSFAEGMRIGGALRQQQQQSRYGEAFQEGGWGAVADTAGGFGDLETAEHAQGVQSDQQEAGIARAQRNATVLSNAATSLLSVPYEQRAQRLQQMAPMLEEMGLPADQIASFDPTDEALGNIRALQGQFSQYTDIRQQGDAIVGIRADGSIEVLRREEPEWQTNGTTPYRVVDGRVEVGQGQIPRVPSGGGGGVQYSPVTPEQAQQYGLPGNGDGFVMGDNGLPRRVGGGGTFPADQRARVAISYDAALEASQFLEQADAQAVERQGTHVSDTPLGQDWAARAAEAIPFDGGTIARMFGGEDYQQYTRASSAFEAAMLPILSGAAVTESEAQRIVRAALPRQGDDQATLTVKARQRRQMLNGAALIGGRDMPFPDLGVPPWAQGGSQAAPEAGDVGLESLTDEQLDQLERELSGQ